MSTGTASRPAPECRPGPAAGSGEGVTSPYWDAVGDAILKGRGRYDSRSNEMLLPADVLMTPLTPSWVARDALVVHEATHAIQDWSDLTMDAASVEADACVAQAIALLTQGGWVDQEKFSWSRVEAGRLAPTDGYRRPPGPPGQEEQ